MSTTLKSRTVQQRAVEATSRLRQALGIDDPKLLSVALAEAAAEEAEHNQTFARQVRAVYDDLVSAQQTRPLRRKSTTVDPTSVQLTPLPGNEGIRIDPYAPLDPYLTLKLYGRDQLRKALSVYSLTKLKQALPPVEQKNPGTKPTNRGQKEAVLDFIVEKVAGSGY